MKSLYAGRREKIARTSTINDSPLTYTKEIVEDIEKHLKIVDLNAAPNPEGECSALKAMLIFLCAFEDDDRVECYVESLSSGVPLQKLIFIRVAERYPDIW